MNVRVALGGSLLLVCGLLLGPTGLLGIGNAFSSLRRHLSLAPAAHRGRLELSDDALDLVVQRIGGLGVESRRLLAAGAAIGRRFRVDLVASVCGVNQRQARRALAEAEARLLVTSSGAGRYTFLHDQIREAVLADLAPGALRRLHQRIAEVLEAIDATDPRYVYATARHYALGESDRSPEKVYASGLAAGWSALADHAPAEALAFLTPAAAAADAAGLVPDASFHLARGLSCAAKLSAVSSSKTGTGRWTGSRAGCAAPRFWRRSRRYTQTPGIRGGHLRPSPADCPNSAGRCRATASRSRWPPSGRSSPASWWV